MNLRRSDKDVALQNFSVYYTWKNIRKQYKNNKLSGKFKLLDGSYPVSGIQDYIEYVIMEK